MWGCLLTWSAAPEAPLNAQPSTSLVHSALSLGHLPPSPHSYDSLLIFKETGKHPDLFSWENPVSLHMIHEKVVGIMCMLVDVEKASSSEVQSTLYVHGLNICRFNLPQTEHLGGNSSVPNVYRHALSRHHSLNNTI